MDKLTLASKFLEETLTKTQAKRRLRVLRDFENWRLFEMGGKSADQGVVKEFVDKYLVNQDQRFAGSDGEFLEALGGEFLNSFEARTLTKALTDLEVELGKARQVILYLAFELPQSEVERLGKWFKQNVGPEALIDIQYRGALIGGAAVSYKGVVKDYSIQARIEAEKKEILRTLLDFRK